MYQMLYLGTCVCVLCAVCGWVGCHSYRPVKLTTMILRYAFVCGRKFCGGGGGCVCVRGWVGFCRSNWEKLLIFEPNSQSLHPYSVLLMEHADWLSLFVLITVMSVILLPF